MNRIVLMIFWVVLLAISSCNSDTDFGGSFNSYKQSDLLKNIGENLILPSYQDLQKQSEALKSAVERFIADKNEENLLALQEQLLATRLSWQNCTPYNFGPAADLGLAANLNIYPVDQNQIETNIISGSYDLEALANNDTKGFQAVGYLIHGLGKSNEEIINSFDENRLQYLLDIVTLIDSTAQQVITSWTNNYLEIFTSESAQGVDASSSVGQLVNAMSREFERNTRDGKIGIPVGIRSLGTPFPEATEAYFAGYSVELLKANMLAFERLFDGDSGESLDDFLIHVQEVTGSGQDLNADINTQFDKIDAAIELINDPLTQEIENNKASVEAIFAEMQGLIVLFKTDMASSMGVIITYQDSDWD